MTTTNKHLVAVYGTLRKGERANDYLNDASHLGQDFVKGTLMINGNGAWFPFVTNGSKEITVDVYGDVSDDTLALMDRYEGYNQGNPESSLFLRDKIHTLINGHHVWLYTMNPARLDLDSAIEIPSGDWKDRKG